MKYSVTEYPISRGGKGLIINVPQSPVVASQFRFRAGARYVNDYVNKSETAHIMEHMSFGASKGFNSALEYDAAFTKNGAVHNAFTSDTSMGYVATCADFEWQRILELQRNALCTPAFTAEEFKSEKGNVRSELTGYLAKAGWILAPKLDQNLGRDTKTVQEGLDSMRNITLDDIRTHHDKTHTMNNLRFIVAGNFTGERMAQLESILEGFTLPEGQRLDLPQDQLHSAAPIAIRRKDVPEIVLNFSLVHRQRLNASDSCAMSLLNHILTGTLHSRVQGAARSRGLAYYVSSYCSHDHFSTDWDFYTESTEGKLVDIAHLIVRELLRVRDGEISDSDLDAAKSYRLGRYQMGMQTTAQIANFMAGPYFSDGVIERHEVMPSRINAVTKDQIVQVVRRFLSDNCWTLGVYGNTRKAVADRLGEIFAPLFNDLG